MKLIRLSALLLLAALTAAADPLIDFSGGFGGTIASGGVGTAITGAGISITSLLGLDMAQNGDVPLNVSGVLHFSTGTVTSVQQNGSSYTVNYDGGGTFGIDGTVSGTGISGNLLTGNFAAGSFTIQQMASGNGYSVFFGGSGTDTKNPALLTYFGVPNIPFTFAGFSIGASFLGSVGANGSFSATAFSTDLTNTATPEPSIILMTGTCLFIVAGQFRKRFRSNTKSA